MTNIYIIFYYSTIYFIHCSFYLYGSNGCRKRVEKSLRNGLLVQVVSLSVRRVGVDGN